MLVVDTFNVLHAALGPVGRGRDMGIGGLGRLIWRSRYAGAGPVWLVCDGPALPHDAPEGVGVEFAGAGREADEVIERLIRGSDAPRRMVVVSSDRRLIRAANRRRANPVTSEAFVLHLLRDSAGAVRAPVEPARVRSSLTGAEVDRWLDEFSRDGALDEALRLRASPEPARCPERSALGRGGEEGERGAPPGSVKGADPSIDPVLREALEHFSGRVAWEDLDMARWLGSLAGGSARLDSGGEPL